MKGNARPLCVCTRPQGKLFRRVQHEECDWSIDERNGERILRLTLVKVVPTKGAQHWTSLLDKSASSCCSSGSADAHAAAGPEI